MSFFTSFWLSIFIIGLGLEYWALRRDDQGDTLSEQVWSLIRNPFGRLLLTPFWTWLTFHFFIEPLFGLDVNDWFVVGFATIFMVGYNRFSKRDPRSPMDRRA